VQCTEIKEHLSEYIDGTLDAQTRTLIEEHLSTCRACEKELDSIRALIQELGSLEPVGVPEDFLSSIHERIENRSGFSKIMRRLFLPARIKIPLQFATVAVTALLVFTVFNMMQPAKRFLGEPLVSEQTKMPKKARSESAKLAYEEGDEIALQNVLEIRPVELALLIGTEKFGITDTPGEAMKAPEPEKKRGAMKEQRYAVSSAPGPEVARQAAPAAGLKLDRLEGEKRTSEMSDRERAVRAALSGVSNLISFFDGKVISVEYAKQSGLPQFIYAEIPTGNYSPFLERLNRIGALQPPPRFTTAKEKEVIPIKIQLLPTW
jgi:hypothetical protein